MSEINPYQSPAAPREPPAPSRRLGEDALHLAAQWHNIVGGLGLLGVTIAIVDATYVIFLSRNSVDPWSRGKGPGDPFSLVMFALMVPQSLFMLAGGISMHQHKRRWLALIGAWAGILPFCGCTVFSLISGVWALIVLQRPEVKALFAAQAISSDES